VVRGDSKSFSLRELLLSVFVDVSLADVASLYYFGVVYSKTKKVL
jgi:hypothetical protein